jgi:DNA-binding HxlR family transcriptional regulator
MKRLEPDDCGFNLALNVIGGKWKSTILWKLHLKPCRFGELVRLIPGITEKVLMQQLREMEGDGIVCRTVFPEAPPRVQYSVTEFGLTLNDAVSAMADWGKLYKLKTSAAWIASSGEPPVMSSRPTGAT